MSKKLILGYVMDRALPGFTAEDGQKLTHINLAFGVLDQGLLDMSRLPHITELPRIRDESPHLGVVLSVGGWGAGGFSNMAKTAQGRKAFAESCARVADQYRLEGIDIDWEYPCVDAAEIDADPADKENFTLLLQALRDALGPERIVSIAVGAGTYFCENTQMDQVARICDYVQLMTYDIRSGFCDEAGHHACLFTAKGDRFDGSAQSTVEDFARHGVPKERMILGAAFYSRRWEGVPNINNGLHQPAKTMGMGGANYGELVNKYFNNPAFVRYWDEQAQAPWLFDGSTFISYDDPQSLRAKCDYIKRENLLGIMYWEHGCDPTRTLLGVLAEELMS
ncbi:MAG: glycosyl hydrolase family 18 protein [Clostridia bacterium]|nr:glycosyl hydrolase family 18 protein [Clostridia bacterium]